jgi:hypothetical protein
MHTDADPVELARHLNIGNHQVEAIRVDQARGLVAGSGLDDLKPRVLRLSDRIRRTIASSSTISTRLLATS